MAKIRQKVEQRAEKATRINSYRHNTHEFYGLSILISVEEANNILCIIQTQPTLSASISQTAITQFIYICTRILITSMNHVLSINKQHYLLRHAQQKILLLTFPHLHPVHKYYANANYTYLHPTSPELLVLNQNEVTILKVMVSPLQLVSQQQSFVDWQPTGGILLQHHIVLFGLHGIVFYLRSSLMEKAWQISLQQDIQELKCNTSEEVLVMKVKEAQNTLFIWRLGEPASKPAQEIILTQNILQFDFINESTLVILTSSELRVYVYDGEFNLYDFYLVNAVSFSSIKTAASPVPPQKVSVSSIILINDQGVASLWELYGIEKRLLKSQSRRVGEFRLEFESMGVSKIIDVWGESDSLGLVCEGQQKQLFTFVISKDLKIAKSRAFEKQLGCAVQEAYVEDSLLLARDASIWKYFSITGQKNYELLDQIECEKAFIWSANRFIFLNEQAMIIREVKGEQSQAIAFKYTRKDKVHSLYHNDDVYFFVNGIRFYKLEKGSISLAGLALKNERAELIEVNKFTSTLTYKVTEQFIVFNYKIMGAKVVCSTLRSSSRQLIPVKGEMWIEKQQTEFSLGQGEKILTVFSLSKLLKLLDSENKIYDYSLHSLNGGGLSLLLKNYVFFLQILLDERGYQIVLIKRLNNLLYHRFDPQCGPVKLVQSNKLIFLVGNSLHILNNRINPQAMLNPFSPPETLLSKQLELKKSFPPQHPRLLQLLIETGRLNLGLQIIKKIRKWLKQQRSLEDLYEYISIDTVTDGWYAEKEEDISRWPEQKTSEQADELAKFSEEILEKIEGLRLREKMPLVFESLIRTFSAFLRKNKAVDYYSQSVLVIAKSGSFHTKGFTSMSIAFLSHSLNKEEAVAELKPQKMSWQWLKQYSIPLWYEGKEQLKKWIEEIAANEYRQNKDPMHCLFWYLLVGKRTLLATLFKNHKLDSKQHQAIADFLGRDFSQPKDKTAAIKNAYVLIDKKRYFHALSFFILGGAIDDCIRLSIDRLKDINLGYLFLVLFKQASRGYITEVLMGGDLWMKHLAYKLQGKHILSYNSLFENSDQSSSWNYTPELTGFHPALLEFVNKIKNSVSVKRQIQEQKMKQNQSQDIFADFYGQSNETQQNNQQQVVELKGDIEELKPKAIKYYLAEGIPLLALALQKDSVEAKEAYFLELYQAAGIVRPEIQDYVVRLQDDIAALQCLLQSRQPQEAVFFLNEMMSKFEKNVSQLSLVEVFPIKKYLVGEILHFAYCSEKILTHFNSRKEKEEVQMGNIVAKLLSYHKISKVLGCLSLDCYQELYECLEDLAHKKLPKMSEGFWLKLKDNYNNIVEVKKMKTLQQMDHFEHVFIGSYRPTQSSNIYRGQLTLSLGEAAQLFLRMTILRHLAIIQPFLANLFTEKLDFFQSFLDNWIAPFRKKELLLEFRTLLKEGTMCKLKLPNLGPVFDQSFNSVYDILAVTHHSYFQKASLTESQEKNKEMQAIEIYRNRSEGVRGFAINIHNTNGVECVALLRKNFKKFQVCNNLVNRDRSKDGYSLLTDDNGIIQNWKDEDLQAKNKYSLPVREYLSHIVSVRDSFKEQFPKTYINYKAKEDTKRIQQGTQTLQSPNCVQCHPLMSWFLTGGKTQIEVTDFTTLKCIDKIKCPGMTDIVKVHCAGSRVGALDSQSHFSLFQLDSIQNKSVFSMKKSGAVDFCFLSPSVLGVISANGVQVVDTLIHPKRQIKFKQTLTKQPISIVKISENRLGVLRKGDLLIYDVRTQRVDESKQIKGRCRSILAYKNVLYIGQCEGKVRTLNLKDLSEICEPTKVGWGDEKEREKINVEQLLNYESVVLGLTSEGSIYSLPRIAGEQN